MKRNESAITLIALIITIIVMLILVGVTISITVGTGGLIEQVQKGTQGMKYKTKEEMLQSAIISSIINNDNKPYLSIIQKDLLKDGLISNKSDITVDDIGNATVKTDIGDVIIKNFGIIDDLNYYTEENFKAILTELQKIEDIIGFTVSYNYDDYSFTVMNEWGKVVARVYLEYTKKESNQIYIEEQNLSQIRAVGINEYERKVINEMNKTFLIDGEEYCVDQALITIVENVFASMGINKQQSDELIDVIHNIRSIVQNEGKPIVKALKQNK